MRKLCAIAVFETEDAAMAAIEKKPKPFHFQTGIVHVNALNDDDKHSTSTSSTSTSHSSNSKSSKQHHQSHANVNDSTLPLSSHSSNTKLSHTTHTTRTKNESQQHHQSQAVPSKATSPWRWTIEPTSGRSYYWHTVTRQVAWERPAELEAEPQQHADASATFTSTATETV